MTPLKNMKAAESSGSFANFLHGRPINCTTHTHALSWRVATPTLIAIKEGGVVVGEVP